MAAQKVQDILAKVCTGIRVCDVFPYEEEGEQHHSVTFAMRFDNPKGDLSADAVNTTLRNVIDEVCRSYPAVTHR